MDIHCFQELLSAVRLLVSEDRCEGRFVLNRQIIRPSTKFLTSSTPPPPAPAPGAISRNGSGPGGDNSKSQLQTLVTRAGHEAPLYKTKQVRNIQFQSTVEFNGMEFVGQPCNNKKLAEKDAAAEALQWLMGGKQSRPEDIERMSALLKPSKNKKQHR